MQPLSDLPAARFSPSLAWSPCNSSVLMFLFRRQPPPFVAAPLAASAVRSDGFWQTARSRVPGRSWRDVVAVKIDLMKRRAADIFRDAMALPAEARAALARRLRESIDAQSGASRRQFVRARRRALRRLRDGLDLDWAPAACKGDLHSR